MVFGHMFHCFIDFMALMQRKYQKWTAGNLGFSRVRLQISLSGASANEIFLQVIMNAHMV